MHLKIAIGLCAGALCSGCATDNAAATSEVRDAPVYTTGSMVPKKDRSPSDVQTVDPQAVRDALGGKPPSVRPGS